MITLKNSDIFSNNGQLAPVMAALADINRQRFDRDGAKALRRIARAIDQQQEDVNAEHKRLIEVHSKRNDDGEPLPVNTIADLVDPAAYQEDFQALMEDTFEVEGIPETLLNGFTLLGNTWVSPIIVESEATND